MSWFAVGAAVVAGVGALSNANARQNAAEYNQEVSLQNAKVAKEQADVNESAQRRRNARMLGRQVTSVADGPGLSGTGLDLIEQSTTEAELDALNIRYAGQLGVMTNLARGELYGMEAEQAESAGYLNAGSAALSGYGGYTKNKP